jgi:phospho-2-dehydro-3-deoxyheptonate aldolase
MENIKNNSIVSEKIMHTRNAISDAINNPDDYLMSVIGPCPLTDDFEIIKSEAILKTDLGNQLPGLISLDRQCFTKPRSNPNDWQGLDSTNPDRTLEIISNLSNEHANVTAEIRFNNNLLRYAAHLSMVWTGARNVNNKELMKTLALYDESLPIGIKNDLDGNIDTALEQINYINQLRQKDSAPAVLIYRGGENAIEPQSSSIEYKNAWDATGER